MTAKEQKPKSVDDWRKIVDDFHEREETSVHERVAIELSIGEAAATGDAAGVRKYQQALSDRSAQDEAIRLGLTAAEGKLAEATEAEAAAAVAADRILLDDELDAAEQPLLKVIDMVNAIVPLCVESREHFQIAQPVHHRCRPRPTEGLAIDRSSRPVWPWSLVEAFVLGRLGTQFGQRRSASGADKAEAQLRSYVDRLRLKKDA
jgi:hypothetical protein